MVALVVSPEVSDRVRAILHAFLGVRFETGVLLGEVVRAFLLAVFREISLRSARVWL